MVEFKDRYQLRAETSKREYKSGLRTRAAFARQAAQAQRRAPRARVTRGHRISHLARLLAYLARSGRLLL